jgi:hypothetical protein
MRKCDAPIPSADARAALRVRLREQLGAYDLVSMMLSGCIDTKTPIHPYAQGPDLANDELGYGEEVSVPVAAEGAGGLVPSTVLQIRTKTGTTNHMR